MMPDPRSRTDNDCTLWYCPDCKESGVVTMDSPDARMVYTVVAALKQAHRAVSPECGSDQRIVHPKSWFRDVRRRD